MVEIYYLGDLIEDNEMDGECGTYGERRGGCRVLLREGAHLT